MSSNESVQGSLNITQINEDIKKTRPIITAMLHAELANFLPFLEACLHVNTLF